MFRSLRESERRLRRNISQRSGTARWAADPFGRRALLAPAGRGQQDEAHSIPGNLGSLPGSKAVCLGFAPESSRCCPSRRSLGGVDAFIASENPTRMILSEAAFASPLDGRPSVLRTGAACAQAPARAATITTAFHDFIIRTSFTGSW
jgi:hypothetical protein